MQTLVLTPMGTPSLLVPWETAITMVYLGKADVLEEYEDTVSSPSVTMRVPAVLCLRRHLSGVKKGVKFSRPNVYLRDRYTCQYCGVRKHPDDLNFDHVVPRVRGGKTTFTNIVTSCFPCNTRKAGRTPEEAGMRLLRKPFKPMTLPIEALTIPEAKVHAKWKPYAITTEAARVA